MTKDDNQDEVTTNAISIQPPPLSQTNSNSGLISPIPHSFTSSTFINHSTQQQPPQRFNNNITTTGHQNNDQDDQIPKTLCPPINFSMVYPGIYRCGMPKKKNFEFLKQLGLKSILTLVLEEYPPMNVKFMEENNIQFFQFGMSGNKEPFADIDEQVMSKAVLTLLDKRNHPIIVHCNKGKHRTGCLIGCLRKFQHWSHTSIFDEYRRFSFPKSRAMDQQFIELFDPKLVWDQMGDYL